MNEEQQAARVSDVDQSDICICGRLSVKIHCPTCGSYTVYALVSQKARVISPVTQELHTVPTFRCRRCATVFNDDQWRYECKAPHAKRSKPLHDASKDNAKLTFENESQIPTDYLDALNAIKKKRGMD